MFTGARKKNEKRKQEMDWQLVASYFKVKSADVFAVYLAESKITSVKFQVKSGNLR